MKININKDSSFYFNTFSEYFNTFVIYKNIKVNIIIKNNIKSLKHEFCLLDNSSLSVVYENFDIQYDTKITILCFLSKNCELNLKIKDINPGFNWDRNIKSTHIGNNSKSVIDCICFNSKSAFSSYNLYSCSKKGAFNSQIIQNIQAFTDSNDSNVVGIPTLAINERITKAEHSFKINQIPLYLMFYINSRGISILNLLKLIKNNIYAKDFS